MASKNKCHLSTKGSLLEQVEEKHQEEPASAAKQSRHSQHVNRSHWSNILLIYLTTDCQTSGWNHIMGSCVYCDSH